MYARRTYIRWLPMMDESVEHMQLPQMEFAEVQKFRFDADVEASDGAAGKLAWVVADTTSHALTYVGVKVTAGTLFFGATYDVPIHLVSAAADDTVTLAIPLEEIKKHRTPPAGAQLTHATQVVAGNRRLGRLVQMTIDKESGALRHLVIERLGREWLVNAGLMTEITAKQIGVNLGQLTPGELTPYRSDAELHDALYERIWDYARMRPDMPGIAIYAIDGVVWLKGYVSSDVNRRIIVDLMQNITGLAELHNELIADNQLAADVAMALAHDPRTANQRIGVYPKLGEVHLRGVVQSPQVVTAAGELAHGLPDVKSVVNELRINPRFTNLPDMAAVTNAEDLVPGGG